MLVLGSRCRTPCGSVAAFVETHEFDVAVDRLGRLLARRLLRIGNPHPDRTRSTVRARRGLRARRRHGASPIHSRDPDGPERPFHDRSHRRRLRHRTVLDVRLSRHHGGVSRPDCLGMLRHWNGRRHHDHHRHRHTGHGDCHRRCRPPGDPATACRRPRARRRHSSDWLDRPVHSRNHRRRLQCRTGLDVRRCRHSDSVGRRDPVRMLRNGNRYWRHHHLRGRDARHGHRQRLRRPPGGG